MSLREDESNRRAQLVCRELRYLIAEYGDVNSNNGERLFKLMDRWMKKTAKIKYKRPAFELSAGEPIE